MKKLQPYIFLLIFFTAIVMIFKYSETFVEGTLGSGEIYRSHKIVDNRLTVITSLGNYEIGFLNSHIAEVNFFNENSPKIDSSHAVILRRDKYPISFTDSPNKLAFARNDFQVLVSKEPFKLSFVNYQDTILMAQNGIFQNDTLLGFRFLLNETEKIYGAGFRTTPSNRRNQRFELYNHAEYGYTLDAPNLNFSVPFVISSKGWGLLFDNAQKGFLDIDITQKNIMEFSSMGGRMAYYVIACQNYDSLLFQYSKLTGFQPMPPRWALGNLQSRFGYESQAQAEEIVGKMQDEKFPMDALIIDLYWFGEGVHDSFYMGNLEWYKKNWPDPEVMIRRFDDRGIKTILITEPFVLPESKYFEMLGREGLLGKNKNGSTYILEDFWFGQGGLFDIFEPGMQDWFWEKYKLQIDRGVAGWWGDLGEPETHPADMIHSIGTAEEVHNIYGHYWHKMLWDKYNENYPNVRLFNLNHSGFAGSQRYSIYPWSGDVSRSWRGFQAQPRAVLGMTLSGFSYMHSDLGGFAGGEKDEELYTRWLQYGTFNPVFRIHGDSKAPVEPLFYSDSVKEVLREFINLRYRMLPYNYTLAWLNATQGTPLTRPLFFEEPGNPEVAEIDDTYLWGQNLLVAPIFEQGQITRKLYMPQGNWFDFFTDEKYTGGKWIEKNVVFDQIPVFVRGGAFIPMIEPIQNTTEYSSENLILHYYFDTSVKESEFTMYEDDGITKDAYLKKIYELLHFGSGTFDGLLMFSFGREKYLNYSGMPEYRNIKLVVHGFDYNPDVIIAGKKLINITKSKTSFEKARPPVAYYDEKLKKLMIRFTWKKDEMMLQVQ